MSSINFIGGEKGGFGKSVTARVLAQYFIDHSRPFVGFDTDRSHSSFTRFYEGFASHAVLARMVRSSFHAGWSREASEKSMSTWLRSSPQSRCVISSLSSSASPLENPFQVKRRPPEATVQPAGVAIGCSETEDTVPGSGTLRARVAASMRPSK